MGHSTKFLGKLLLLCLAVIYPQPVLLFGRVLGWKGSLASYKGNKRARDPCSEGANRANRPKEQEARVRHAFWDGGPPVMETHMERCVLLTLHAAEEGYDNKNTG